MTERGRDMDGHSSTDYRISKCTVMTIPVAVKQCNLGCLEVVGIVA